MDQWHLYIWKLYVLCTFTTVQARHMQQSMLMVCMAINSAIRNRQDLSVNNASFLMEQHYNWAWHLINHTKQNTLALLSNESTKNSVKFYGIKIFIIWSQRRKAHHIVIGCFEMTDHRQEFKLLAPGTLSFACFQQKFIVWFLMSNFWSKFDLLLINWHLVISL